MRFHPYQFVGAIVTAISPVLVHAACSDSAILELVSASAFEGIVGCIYTGSDGPQTCVSNVVNGLSAELTSATECRGNVDTFAAALAANAFLAQNCQIIFTYDCLDTIDVEMAQFVTSSGKSILYRQCTSALVREYAVNDPFTYLIKKGFGGNPNPNVVMDDIVGRPMSDISLSEDEIVCRIAYKAFYDAVYTYGGTPSELINVCLQNPSSADCSASTDIIGLLQGWIDTAGFSSMDMLGPYCSSAEMNLVDITVPIPVLKFTLFCEYNPTDAVCIPSSQANFWSQVQDLVNTDCDACYTEFHNSVIAGPDDSSLCGANVLADACVTYYAAALESFESCAGYVLSTSDVTTTTTTTTTTAATTTTSVMTTSDTVSQTTEPVVTTTTATTISTKSSFAMSLQMVSHSLVLMVCVFVFI